MAAAPYALRCLTAVEFAAARKTKKWEVVSNDLNNPCGLFTTGPASGHGPAAWRTRVYLARRHDRQTESARARTASRPVDASGRRRSRRWCANACAALAVQSGARAEGG